MANVYSRLTKINNAKGRSQYISDPKRQEEILLHKTDLEYGWSVIEDFEKLKSNVDKENWQARELVVALPNDLSNDKVKLEKVCDELTQNLIENMNMRFTGTKEEQIFMYIFCLAKEKGFRN